MSYVIHVWEKPVPSTLEEAWDILGPLVHDSVRQERPKLSALRNALWERYPRDPNTDLEDPVWGDGSLARKHDGSPLLTLGIVNEHLDEVVPFVAKTANALGLVVYDLQYGTAYLPSGAVLGKRPVPPAVGAPAPFGQREVERHLVAALKPFMKSEGFEWTKLRGFHRFVCPFAGGEHYFVIWTGNAFPCVGIDFLLYTYLDRIDSVVASTVSPGKLRAFAGVEGSFSDALKKIDLPMANRLLRLHNEKFVVCSIAEIAPLLGELVPIFKERVLSLMRRCESVRGVWQNALVKIEAGAVQLLRGSLYGDIVVCRLMGDRRFEDLGQAQLESYSEHVAALRAAVKGTVNVRHIESIGQKRQKFLEFMTYMRNEIRPLPDAGMEDS